MLGFFIFETRAATRGGVVFTAVLNVPVWVNFTDSMQVLIWRYMQFVRIAS